MIRKCTAPMLALLTTVSACQQGAPRPDGATASPSGKIDSIANQHWHLIELNGKTVDGAASQFFIKLTEPEGRVQAKAGCNSMTGQYAITERNRIRFSLLASTRMACPDMSQENALAAALAAANHFTHKGDTLSLLQDSQVLARFVPAQ